MNWPIKYTMKKKVQDSGKAVLSLVILRNPPASCSPSVRYAAKRNAARIRARCIEMFFISCSAGRQLQIVMGKKKENGDLSQLIIICWERIVQPGCFALGSVRVQKILELAM